MMSGDCWNDNSRLLGRLRDHCWGDKWRLLRYLTTLGMSGNSLHGNWGFLGRQHHFETVTTVGMTSRDCWDKKITKWKGRVRKQLFGWRLLGWRVVTAEIRKLRNGRDECGSSCLGKLRVLTPCSPRRTEETHESRQCVETETWQQR